MRSGACSRFCPDGACPPGWKNCRGHRVPLGGGHAGQPFGQPLGQKGPVHPEVHPHHLGKIGQLAGIRIGESAVNNHAAAPGGLIVPLKKGGHLRRAPSKPVEINGFPGPVRERGKIIIQFFQSSLLKHNAQSPSPPLSVGLVQYYTTYPGQFQQNNTRNQFPKFYA